MKTSKPNSATDRMMHVGMLICCAVMLAPLALFLMNGGAISDIGGNLWLLLPLALCLGMHFVMHRFMGMSCHGKSDETGDQPDTENVALDVNRPHENGEYGRQA